MRYLSVFFVLLITKCLVVFLRKETEPSCKVCSTNSLKLSLHQLKLKGRFTAVAVRSNPENTTFGMLTRAAASEIMLRGRTHLVWWRCSWLKTEGESEPGLHLNSYLCMSSFLDVGLPPGYEEDPPHPTHPNTQTPRLESNLQITIFLFTLNYSNLSVLVNLK